MQNAPGTTHHPHRTPPQRPHPILQEPERRGLTPVQRRLLWFAALTAASGLFHVLVWLYHGAPSLVGPVTWRKPIVFGLSIGVLFASLAWIAGFLPQRRGLTRSSWALIALVAVELGLIDMQQWRGVPSHFNMATTFDFWIFQVMGLIIVTAAIILVRWTWQLLRLDARAVARPEQLHAARAAMLLLTVGNVVGVALGNIGSAIARLSGAPPASVGGFGDLRLSHAIGMHALQVLPVAALAIGWLVRRHASGAAASRQALLLTRATTAVYVGLLLFVMTRAIAGEMTATLIAMAPLAAASLAATVTASVDRTKSGDATTNALMYRFPSNGESETTDGQVEERQALRTDPRAVRHVATIDAHILATAAASPREAARTR